MKSLTVKEENKMEFKGTKGKWRVTAGVVRDIDTLTKIATIHIENNEYSQKDHANALLISKAPEMLELLKHIANCIEHNDIIYLKRITQLIKESTENNLNI